MTKTTATATATQTTVTATKAPSKKSLALAIFSTAMAMRAAGQFGSNKAFRAHVLSTIEADLGVSTASAATMYNSAKKDAETADTGVALGRDPKKVKAPKGNGQRGRPAGSRNKTKDAAPINTLVVNEPADTTVVVTAETPVAADAAA